MKELRNIVSKLAYFTHSTQRTIHSKGVAGLSCLVSVNVENDFPLFTRDKLVATNELKTTILAHGKNCQ